MIAVMVSVEGEADRFVGDGFDLRDYLPRARRVVSVDHEHIIFKDYPAVVAMADQQIALMEINAVRQLIDFADFYGSGFRRKCFCSSFRFGCGGAEQRCAAEQHFTS